MYYATIRAVALTAAFLSSTASAQNEDAWDQGYDAVRAMMRQDKWSDAKRALEELLTKNEGKSYAKADRQAIVEDHQQCSFHVAAKPPKPAELISGKLEQYDAASGRVRLRYVADAMSDWSEGRSGNLIHPMVFAGPFTVTLSGKAYPADSSLGFVYDLGSEGYFRIDLGGGETKTGLRRIEGEKETVLEKRDAPLLRAGAAYTAQLKADRANVELLIDKKSVWKHKRNAGDGGFFGLTPGNTEDVLLEGAMEPSWFQNIVDDELSRQREAFKNDYDREKALPGWLFAELQMERVPSKHDFDETAKTEAASEFWEEFRKGEFAAAAAKLDALSDADIAAPDRAYLRALVALRAGNTDQALTAVTAALGAAPERTYVRLLHADILTELRRPAEALR
jgi:hypothetical protein